MHFISFGTEFEAEFDIRGNSILDRLAGTAVSKVQHIGYTNDYKGLGNLEIHTCVLDEREARLWQ